MSQRSDCVTSVGLQRMASILAANGIGTHMAFGDDDTPAQVSDIALVSEIYREALDSISQVNVAVRCILEIIGNDIGVGDQTIREVSINDAAVGGNTICRHALETPVVINGLQRLRVVYNLVLGVLV